MSREDIIAVASRIFSIFVLVTVVRSIPGTVALLGQDEVRPSWVLVGLVTACIVSVCAYLWFFPLTIARKLLPAMSEPRSETALDGSVALSVGLTLLGIWVLAYALADTIYWATLFFLARRNDDGYLYWTNDHLASIVTTGAELAIGFWLILGSTGIKKLIYRFRYGAYQD